MIKSKAEMENMHSPAACWDPVLKRNRGKRMKLFIVCWRLVFFGLV